jgi:hypothetical protein
MTAVEEDEREAARQTEITRAETQQTTPPPQNPTYPEPSRKAQNWAESNEWFGSDKIMTSLQELKEKHPTLYAEAVALGQSAEKDRVGAWMVYVDADADAVALGIKNGENLSATNMAEFNRKLMAGKTIKGATEETTEQIVTDAPVKEELTAEQKGLNAFNAEFDKTLKQ